MTEDKKILKVASHIGAFLCGLTLTSALSIDCMKSWGKEVQQKHEEELRKEMQARAECLDLNILILETIRDWGQESTDGQELYDRVEEALRLRINK